MTAVSPTRICVATSIHPDYDARVFRHAKSLAALGYEVDLVCPWRPSDDPLPPRLRIVPFRRVPARALRPFLIPPRMLPLLLRKPYDVYHFHDLDLLPLFALLKVLRGFRVIYDCHENYAKEMLYRAYLPRWSRYPLAAAVTVAEPLIASLIRDVVIVVPSQEATFPAPVFRTTLVRNFADLDLAAGRRGDYVLRPPVCVSIASQYRENGALFVLDVAAEVHRRRPQVQFRMTDRYGSDERFRLHVIDLIRSRGLGSFVGHVPHIPAHRLLEQLNTATIGLVLDLATPSRIAALPNKTFEYMAAGLPIVAADLPNVRQIISQVDCGILVTPGRADAFADAICGLVDDPAAASRMGERGHAAFLTEFNWQAEVMKLVRVYTDRGAADARTPSNEGPPGG